MNIKDYKKVIPPRFYNVSYETDVSDRMKEIFTKQIKSGNGVYLYGPRGVGKTHVVCAIAKNILESGIDVWYLNTSEFLEKLRQEFNNETYSDDNHGLLKEVMNFKGVLILDDIGAEKASEWTRERLYLVINKKYEEMQPIIFTSNCDLEILSARLEDRITSRIIGMTEILEKNGEDRRLK